MTVALSQKSRSFRMQGALSVLIAMTLAGAMSLSMPPTSAFAGYAPYLANHYMNPGEQVAGPTFSSITNSTAGGYWWVATAAHTPGGWSLYGSYVTGYTHACHAYAAGNPLGGMAQNAELYNLQPMNGGIDTTASC